ncbi:MAG: hypothetical protein RL757_2752 [Bacteroidota bacterium]|jgi:molybdopterin-containing oxidoreductase family iron-sulfur binding subunit
MEFNQQNVWTGVEDLNNTEAYHEALAREEFSLSDTLQGENNAFASTRRDFLKYLGFGVGAATVAASCEIPVKRAVPYVQKPDSMVPGIANYYASSYVKGGDYCAILVKNKEGRPIKIEGNGLSGITMGGTSARAQASVLELYDYNRIQNPAKLNGDKDATKMTWAQLDQAVAGKLNAQSRIAIVTNTILSPMTKQSIADFSAKFPSTKVYTYDPISSAAMLEANEKSFGDRAVANYSFDKADVIVSFGADFLGTWVSPIEYAGQYAQGRKLRSVEGAKMSRHIQVESYMSLTGSNADNRILVKPSEMGAAIAALYTKLGGQGVNMPKLNDKATKAIERLAAELQGAKGKSLVVSASNNVAEQILVNSINSMLGNVGATMTFNGASMQRQGDERQVQAMMSEGADAVIVLNANPVFELPFGDKVAEFIKKASFSVSTTQLLDETAACCQYVAPSNHFLESWGDAQPKRGQFSLIQPTISTVFDTRQIEQSLLTWAGACPQTETPMYDYLRSVWQTNMFPKQKEYLTFQAFWDVTLHNGVFVAGDVTPTVAAFRGNVAESAVTQPATGGMEITFFETVNMGNGQYANNPWLQEMPDPVTRTVWNNTLALPLKWNGKKAESMKGLQDGDKVKAKIGGKDYEVAVVRQFGQPENTVAIALGYGRLKAGYCGTQVGTNVQNASPVVNGLIQYFSVAEVSDSIGKDKYFASVQYHHSMGLYESKNKNFYVDEQELGYQGTLVPRTVIRQTELKDLKTFTAKNSEQREEYEKLNRFTLYRGHEDLYKRGHHWGMHIDLNACIGCGACTVACMSENNVPVVGKFEVSRHHEMSWLRIDRYFYGDVENPNAVYQPMMCQHCDNAPCENVCPVNASSHSAEGLNQMAYNRCIGTRYCANNCPYKVRRFNWQDYTTADLFPMNERDLRGKTLGMNGDMPYGADNLTRMVLNPDVTVRSRGVIEKCSLCVQRIQDGKLTAKRENRELRDGDIKTACQASCPTGAIVFGDQNNKESEVVKLKSNELNFIVLEEVNVRSNMTYGIKVRNKDEQMS